MATSIEPRQISLLRNALASFPASWRVLDQRRGCIDIETSNPTERIRLRVQAATDADVVVVTILRASDGQFMAQAEFPLASWEAAKEFLEGIALEAFVVGVDLKDGAWTGSMILRSADLERRRDFSYVRSWLGTYDFGE